jgi:hypothetical protein
MTAETSNVRKRLAFETARNQVAYTLNRKDLTQQEERLVMEALVPLDMLNGEHRMVIDPKPELPTSNLVAYVWTGSGMERAIEGDRRCWYAAEAVDALLAKPSRSSQIVDQLIESLRGYFEIGTLSEESELYELMRQAEQHQIGAAHETPETRLLLEVWNDECTRLSQGMFRKLFDYFQQQRFVETEVGCERHNIRQCEMCRDAEKAVETPARPSGVSATERLHRLCDALSEQADESPYTREEWDRIDKQTVRMQAALRQILGWREIDDTMGGRLREIERIATQALEGVSEKAVETTASPAAFQVKNGPASLPCDHCGRGLSEHICPPGRPKVYSHGLGELTTADAAYLTGETDQRPEKASADTICECGKRMGEHPAQPPWWPCMFAQKTNGPLFGEMRDMDDVERGALNKLINEPKTSCSPKTALGNTKVTPAERCFIERDGRVTHAPSCPSSPRPACICGQGDKPVTQHFSGCPVSPLYDSPESEPV